MSALATTFTPTTCTSSSIFRLSKVTPLSLTTSAFIEAVSVDQRRAIRASLLSTVIAGRLCNHVGEAKSSWFIKRI